jgi:pilus assembly protein Flp/PilA
MYSLIKALTGQRRGATAIEYAFIASLISIAIYAAAVTVGSNLSAVFNSVATSL